MKYFIITLFLLSLFSVKTFSQKTYDVEGRYSVGKTACTIEWDTRNKTYKVYWDEGTGHTLLFFKEESPNGNFVYDEYESDGVTFSGSFIFRDDSHDKGKYERNDGKTFNIKRK
jgi:hypothetical protein